MKNIKLLFLFSTLITLFSSSVLSQCTLACYSDLYVSLDASGSATLTPNEILAQIPPTCGSLTVSPNTFNCTDVGSTIIVYVTETSSGNSCWSNIHIEDKTAPTISCIANIIAALPMDGTFELFSTTLLASESDNCPLTYTIVPDILTCTHVGSPTIVTIMATDPGGNSATCFSTINLQVTPVAMACYAQLHISLPTSGVQLITPDMILLAPTPPVCALQVSIPMVSCADIGAPINIIVEDTLTGNSCFSTIVVEDKIAPTISCFANINATLPMDGTLELTSTMLLDSESDNCPLTYTIVPDVLTCSHVGSTNTVTITATDPGGNSATCFSTINLQAIPVAMICYAQLNISLPPSGVFTITPDMILLPPTPPACALQVSVPMVSCADVGAPINIIVQDILTGNSCFSTILVEDKIAPTISCNTLTNVQLGVGGILVLDANDLLASSSDNCDLLFVMSPAQFDCSDKGKTRTVNITATDPGGNTVSCSADVFVENPKPSSCNINVPASVPCGASGVGFSVTISGGYGPFIYDWSIKGNTNGWSITGGQGTPNITMDVGIKKINLNVKITDVCGKSKKCNIKVTCDSAPFRPIDINKAFVSGSSDSELKVFPNPALNKISWIRLDDFNSPNEDDRFRILDTNGHVLADGKASIQNLNIQFLPSGLYYFQILGTSNVLTKRFIKI